MKPTNPPPPGSDPEASDRGNRASAKGPAWHQAGSGRPRRPQTIRWASPTEAGPSGRAHSVQPGPVPREANEGLTSRTPVPATTRSRPHPRRGCTTKGSPRGERHQRPRHPRLRRHRRRRVVVVRADLCGACSASSRTRRKRAKRTTSPSSGPARRSGPRDRLAVLRGRAAAATADQRAGGRSVSCAPRKPRRCTTTGGWTKRPASAHPHRRGQEAAGRTRPAGSGHWRRRGARHARTGIRGIVGWPNRSRPAWRRRRERRTRSHHHRRQIRRLLPRPRRSTRRRPRRWCVIPESTLVTFFRTTALAAATAALLCGTPVLRSGPRPGCRVAGLQREAGAARPDRDRPEDRPVHSARPGRSRTSRGSRSGSASTSASGRWSSRWCITSARCCARRC